MSTSSTTFQNALRALGIDDADNSNASIFKTSGVLPSSIISHTVAKDYIMMGMSPSDFIKKHGSTAMDFEDIKAHFKLICEDFGDDLQLDESSKAVEFCSKIIYEVGPEARQVRKKDNDKTWKFLFMYKKDNKLSVKVAFVSTYKKDDSEYILEKTTNKITLSVKAASLLALCTLELLNALAISKTPPIFLLTPLAGAVFSREDLPALSASRNRPVGAVLNTINASCQSGGYNLRNGNTAVAAVAAIVATRNVRDDRMKFGIIGKTLKQYISHKKPWDITTFNAYAKYGHGGVPSAISPENLIKLFEDIHKVSPVTATIAAKQTIGKSSVLTPAKRAGSSKKQQPEEKPGLAGDDSE